MLYDVIDVPQPEDCQNCTPCMRMRLMEMGFIFGQQIEIEKKRLGLWMVHMISDNGTIEQTFALRPEELDRICIKEKL
jgi:Fe2+ transport system protein FeoA